MESSWEKIPTRGIKLIVCLHSAQKGTPTHGWLGAEMS